MNFRISSKRPLTPPLIFGKSYCILFQFPAQKYRDESEMEVAPCYNLLAMLTPLTLLTLLTLLTWCTLSTWFTLLTLWKWLPLLTWLTLLRGTRGTRGATVPKIHPFCCGHPSLTETLFKKNINLSSTEPLYPHHLHSGHHFAFHGRVHPKSVKVAGSANFRMDLPGSLVVAQSPNKWSCLFLAIR